MSENKSLGGQAKDLVLLFYELTGLRFTNRDIMRSIVSAKSLLNAGYTFDEVKDTIEYCCENQPSRGIYSFGFISHEINKVLTILQQKKKEEITTKAIDKNIFSDYGITKISNKDKMKERDLKIDTSIFD